MRKEPEYYLEIGYEDHGYVSPELSSSDTYPDYIKEEVDETVKEVLKHQNTDTVTFAFMTDIHYALSYNHEIRMKRTLNAYKEIAKRVHIDKLILGGDYTNEACKEHKSKCYTELRAQFSGIDYYPVHGNHDDGSIWDDSYLKADKSTNHLTHDELFVLFYNHVESIGAKLDKNNRSLYYYVDDEVKKTRYICLDSGDIPYVYDENGKLKYAGQHIFALSQKQIDWLLNEALNFNEEGWSVMFFLHSLALPSKPYEELNELRKRMPIFNDIIDAYKVGGKCKSEVAIKDFENYVDVDFGDRIRAEVIGAFVGDYHIDLIEKTKENVPYILTANSVTYYDINNPNCIKRYDGDKTELLFDIVTVDKKTKDIYITRVGAGEDRSIKY